MSRPANVATGKCRDRQMSRPAEFQSANVAIGKCRDRQMSRPANVATGKCRDRQKSDRQKSDRRGVSRQMSHNPLRRRYRKWKKDKKRKKLQRRNSDSTEDGNNSPNVPQPQTQKRAESDLNLPAYRFDGQILEQQLHAQQIELLRQQSVALYGQNLNEQQKLARLPNSVNVKRVVL